MDDLQGRLANRDVDCTASTISAKSVIDQGVSLIPAAAWKDSNDDLDQMHSRTWADHLRKYHQCYHAHPK
jgi:hypothetical protein